MSEYVSEINTNMLLILFAVVNKITAKHSVHVSLSFPSWEELNANRSQPPPPDTFWMEALASQGEPEQVTEEDWKE
ncbi:hypothetical protein KKA15_02425 [Patescibacteria group bacterium]|nr:hypothetical protein [Patescibacteria group bacterium]